MGTQYSEEVHAVASYADSVIDGLADTLRRHEEPPEFSVVLAECCDEPAAMFPHCVMTRKEREAIVLRHFFTGSNVGNSGLVKRHYFGFGY